MIYVGLKKRSDGVSHEVFSTPETPTEKSHGARYFAVIGPFDTFRGADFMAWHGHNNPHCQHVSDAERLGKLYAVTS